MLNIFTSIIQVMTQKLLEGCFPCEIPKKLKELQSIQIDETDNEQGTAWIGEFGKMHWMITRDMGRWHQTIGDKRLDKKRAKNKDKWKKVVESITLRNQCPLTAGHHKCH